MRVKSHRMVIYSVGGPFHSNICQLLLPGYNIFGMTLLDKVVNVKKLMNNDDYGITLLTYSNLSEDESALCLKYFFSSKR